MDASKRQKWLPMVLILGALYFLLGVGFAMLASWSASDWSRMTWNRLGFAISAIAFTLHIAYEHFRVRSAPFVTASHVAMAVALGALALAVKANVHGYSAGSGNKRLLAFALVAWPAVTAIPAFVLALFTTAALTPRPRKHG